VRCNIIHIMKEIDVKSQCMKSCKEFYAENRVVGLSVTAMKLQ
jgi:hypothetical protein